MGLVAIVVPLVNGVLLVESADRGLLGIALLPMAIGAWLIIVCRRAAHGHERCTVVLISAGIFAGALLQLLIHPEASPSVALVGLVPVFLAAPYLDPRRLALVSFAVWAFGLAYVASGKFLIMARTDEVADIAQVAFPIMSSAAIMALLLFLLHHYQLASRGLRDKDAAVAASYTGVAITDLQGTFSYVNAALARSIGCEPEELIGRPSTELWPERSREVLEEVAEHGSWTGEQVVQHRDGTPRSVQATVNAVKDAGGQPSAIVGTYEDITDRKRAEAALQRTTQLLEASQSLARVGGWEIDLAHDSLFWTAETYRIHDVSPAEYTPTVATAIQFYAPESIPLITAAVQGAVEHGTPFDVELELITAAGRRVWVHTSGAVTVEQGRPVKVAGAFQDITEAKRLEAQLRQAAKMEAVGQLAGGIAHDFNNLLTAIIGYSEMVREGLGADDPNQDDLGAVMSAAERAAELTRQLLAFSRRQVLHPRIVQPAELVAGVAAMLRRLLGEHIELVIRDTSDRGAVRIDPSQFEQIILNLAVNARDAMPEGGTLTIETANVELDAADAASYAGATPGPQVMLTVSDTGHGMDAATLEHIYEPFFTTKECGKGTGLGLATVYGIVAQSGGSISVDSEPGDGTSFAIYLPRVDEEVAPVTTPSAEALPIGTETILLVEDEAAVRTIAGRILTELGYTVLEASSGAEALALSATHAGGIDLLVTDVVMPGLQGHQVAAELRADHPNLRVLYVSGFTDNPMIHDLVVSCRSS